MEELIERGEVRYAWIGVSTRTLTASLAGEAGTAVERGAAIECVVPGSPAESAGLRAGDREVTVDGLTFLAGGDVVVAIDGDATSEDPDGSWRRACVPDRRRAHRRARRRARGDPGPAGRASGMQPAGAAEAAPADTTSPKAPTATSYPGPPMLQHINVGHKKLADYSSLWPAAG